MVIDGIPGIGPPTGIGGTSPPWCRCGVDAALDGEGRDTP